MQKDNEKNKHQDYSQTAPVTTVLMSVPADWQRIWWHRHGRRAFHPRPILTGRLYVTCLVMFVLHRSM